MEWEVFEEKQLANIIPDLLPEILRSRVVLLDGDMGSGKTTFVRYFNTLVTAEPASSPTFSIVNEYSSKQGKIYHFDLYRLSSTDDLIEIGFEEYLAEEAICFVEWPALGAAFYPEECLHLQFIKTSEQRRKVIVNPKL